VSLPTLSAFSPQLGDAEAADRRRQAGVLCREWLAFRGQDLRARANNDSVGLRISAIAGIADRVDHAILVVLDRSAPIVAAIGIGLGEVKPSMLVDLRDHPGRASGDGIGGIDHRRRVGIRDIQRIDRRKISHECHHPAHRSTD